MTIYNMGMTGRTLFETKTLNCRNKEARKILIAENIYHQKYTNNPNFILLALKIGATKILNCLTYFFDILF